jgi:hypothetical protein
MTARLCLTALAFLITLTYGTEVVDLNTKTFEHLTQATTGHTTGDWFVKVLIRLSTSYTPESIVYMKKPFFITY